MRGVVIGKFYPPHLGHNYLIDFALAHCEQVDVLVVDNPEYKIAAAKRREWLQARHPKAAVQVIPDIYDDDNSEAWALHTIKFLGHVPDVVYSSEPYGKPWAEAMGCNHVEVDVERATVPISGTKVREDILKSWKYLSNQTKVGLAIRIVVLGAESTGTTTLSRELAEALNQPWAPELGRFYTESLLTTDKKWTNEDFYRIGKLQQDYQDAMAELSSGVVVYDTNAVATEVWQRRYMGKTTDEMRAIGAREKVDLYIVTGDEIPFVQDGIRDGEHVRHKMHKWFIDRVKQTGVPYIIVTGPRGRRLATALHAAEQTIKTSRTIR